MPSEDFSTLFTEYSSPVPDAAIDYNGHLNDAAYAQVLTDANEMFLDVLGLSAAYRDATGFSMYTVEITIKFLAEVGRGEVLHAVSRLAWHDAKRLQLRTILLNADSVQVARGDSLYLHVDTSAGRVSAFPTERMNVLADVQSTHDGVSTDR